MQNFTQSVEYYKPERIVQVPRRSSVRHRETLLGARETFPSVVRLIYRVDTTAHGIQPSDIYPRLSTAEPFPLYGSRDPLGSASAARGVIYPPENGRGCGRRGGSPLRARPPSHMVR